MGAQPRAGSCWATAPGKTHSPRQNTCSWSARGSQLMPSARVFGPWPEHSNPAASCLQWSCALQAEAVDTFFFFACAHLTRGRCCTSDLIAPAFIARTSWSVPVLRIGTLASWLLPLVLLPLHRNDWFPQFHTRAWISFTPPLRRSP